MTDYERLLLEQNNKMLKQIIEYINNKDNLKEFAMNILANVISNN